MKHMKEKNKTVALECKDDPSKDIVVTGIPNQIYRTNNFNDKTGGNFFLNQSKALIWFNLIKVITEFQEMSIQNFKSFRIIHIET